MIITKNDPYKTEEDSTSWSPYASIIFSTATGACMGAARGGLAGSAIGGTIGLASSTIDEYLISKDVLHKHLFTSTIYWWQTAFFPLASMDIYLAKSLQHALPISLSLSMSYINDDFFDFTNKVDIPMDALLTLNKFFYLTSHKNNNFYEEYNNPFILTFTTGQALNLLKILLDAFINIQLGAYNTEQYKNILSQNIHNDENKNLLNLSKYNFLHYIGLNSKLEKYLPPLLKALNLPLPDKYLPFIKISSQILIFKGSKSILENVVKWLNIALAKVQEKIILTKASNFLNSEESRKIIALDKHKGDKLLKNLIPDLFSLNKEAASINKLTLQSAEFLGAQYHLEKLSPGILLFYTFPIKFKQDSQIKLNKALKTNYDAQTAAKNNAQNILNDNINNIELIRLRNGNEFMEEKFNEAQLELQRLYSEMQYLGTESDLKNHFYMYLNYIIDIFTFGYQLLSKQLDIDTFPLAHQSAQRLISLFNSNIEIQRSNIEPKLSLSRVKELLALFSLESKYTSRTKNNEDKIIISNYTLSLKGYELVNIAHLEFQKGFIYAITGESGSGKTTFMIDLAIGVLGSLMSTGEISLPKDTNITYLTQNIYLPPTFTLREAIYFPKIVSQLSTQKKESLDQRILDLMIEFEVFSINADLDPKSFILEKLESKDFKLSGGQLKKIAIIQAILENPDILIMDETFEGINKEMLIKIQFAIKHYLPNTIIIVIDHHAHDNNYYNFYNKEVSFVSYNYMLLKKFDELYLAENEIGLFIEQERLLCRTKNNSQALEIKPQTGDHTTGIPLPLYNKILIEIKSLNSSYIPLELSSEEQQQIKSFIYKDHYLTKNTWTTISNIESRSYYDDPSPTSTPYIFACQNAPESLLAPSEESDSYGLGVELLGTERFPSEICICWKNTE